MDTSETYRRVLRISAVVMAVVLLFQSGTLDERTSSVFTEATNYLGATVGMSASIAPNEFNTITAELTKQQQLLAAREQAITEREIAVEMNQGTDSNTTARTTYLLTAVLFVQLVLIILNYGLDFLRSREMRVVSESRPASG